MENFAPSWCGPDKSQWGKKLQILSVKQFVPNPNIASTQMVKHHRYAGKKEGRISYPEEQAEGVVFVS